ncbi:MAG: polyprenyl synthetase family protein [Actinobacteria bacterium]|nr:MAG: polyprenyl synthetase family protein [Actinomycetota bacterium]
MSLNTSAKSTLSKNTKKLMVKVDDELKNILSNSKTVKQGCLDTLSSGGKKVRPALTIICGHHQNEQQLIPAAASLELLHSASLIHDDVLDYSKTRRGKPTVYAKYGYDYALKTGDFIFSSAFLTLSRCNNPKLNRILAASAFKLSLGEILQRNTAYNARQNIDLYYKKIAFKTASLFRAACLIGAYCADLGEAEVEALGDYGHNLGLAFQVFDDILDFIGDERTMGKAVASDIRDGMMTLPIFLALDELSEKSVLVNAVQNRDNSDEEILEAVVLVKQTKAIKKSRSQAKDYIGKAIASLNILKTGNIKDELTRLANLVIERNM